MTRVYFLFPRMATQFTQACLERIKKFLELQCKENEAAGDWRTVPNYRSEYLKEFLDSKEFSYVRGKLRTAGDIDDQGNVANGKTLKDLAEKYRTIEPRRPKRRRPLPASSSSSEPNTDDEEDLGQSVTRICKQLADREHRLIQRTAELDEREMRIVKQESKQRMLETVTVADLLARLPA